MARKWTKAKRIARAQSWQFDREWYHQLIEQAYRCYPYKRCAFLDSLRKQLALKHPLTKKQVAAVQSIIDRYSNKEKKSGG